MIRVDSGLTKEVATSSQMCVYIQQRPSSHHSHFYRIESQDKRRGLSFLEKYKERLGTDGNVTNICFRRCHNHRKPYSLRPRAKKYILMYFSMYSPKYTGDSSRSKLVLHHPFREVKDPLNIPHIHNHAYSTYTEAYAECQALFENTLVSKLILKTTLGFVKWTLSTGVTVLAYTLI